MDAEWTDEHDEEPIDEWPEEFVVEDPIAVLTLLDLKAIRCLGPFLHGPRTLTAAAGELEMSTSSLAYWIGKLERVGLIVRLAPTRRAGMAMPRYRAPARTLFLPFSAVPPGLTSELLDGGRHKLLDRFTDGLDEAIRKEGHTGLQFAASGPIGVEIDARRSPDRTAAPSWTDYWGTLSLTKDDASTLADELHQLVERYRAKETGRTEFVVHVGIAPVPKLRYRSA